MSKPDFISQMVEDTITDTNFKASNVLSFEPPVNTYNLNVELHEEKKCYIVHNESKSIEIPINWGPFKNRISREFTIDQGEDRHMILSVLSIFFEKTITHAKFSIILPDEASKAA